MAALGPFEPAPRIAAGVSGGADSMALAILALTWTRERGGSLLVLVVDHRLRSESGREAAQTVARLDARGIEAKILEIQGLEHGPSLAERARMARFAALEAACAEAGILHLLLGHHAGDQAETLQIRALGGSGPGGMAGMAPVVETRTLRLLRPLLAIPPARLRATLRSFGVAWVEDPSNNDASALRPRLRLLRRDNAGAGSATAALVAASVASGRLRNEQEGQHRLQPGRRCRDAARGLRSAIRGSRSSRRFSRHCCRRLPGRRFRRLPGRSPPSRRRPDRRRLRGSGCCPAGRLGTELLAVREDAAMAPPVSAQPGAVWDGRFRLNAEVRLPAEATWARWETTPRGSDGSPRCPPQCCGPSLPSGSARHFSPCRICSILTVRDANAFPCYSAHRGRPLPHRFGLGMHEGS